MNNKTLFMTHQLQSIPSHPLEDGYRFRYFGKENDEHIWANIVAATGEFPDQDKALERFHRELAVHTEEMKRRIIFIEPEEGEGTPIGTATAWWGEWEQKEIGRLHWVEIIPAFQGKGLGKPLITKAMQTLALYHDQAYLKTQYSSEAAIHLYKKLGWEMV
ncbi:GNAT family N-acetyltransferase [Virgibacillus halodenitrificans]|uniref:GNAT family N-acetyltransferase n=1 Tax=Virgibacillus halodenitrificans TaxID=1482 RepID=UPI0024BFA12A|nr:GNAT family N-acetyltransferase [Virgibacillus halodenitrificans]WHX26255.1 GNAT family N-acetyltransferase [Virgibacillus halodenitrificans]